MITKSCPCESGKAYAECCQPCHQGTPAINAEALMRSRYSAYVFGLEQYLLDTWHPDTRPEALKLNGEMATKWLGLRIKRFEQKSKTNAIVEFIARYKVGGQQAERLHEVSQFLLTDRWYYVSGELE
jgi:SEC-C motif domain protein